MYNLYMSEIVNYSYFPILIKRENSLLRKFKKIINMTYNVIKAND